MDAAWLRIGTVRAVNPARRELRIAVEESESRQFDQLNWITVQSADNAPLRCKVVSMKRHEDLAIVGLAAGVTKDAIALMRGAEIVIPREERLVATEDYALAELVGCNVYDEQGQRLGEVQDAFRTPAHGVLEIVRPDGSALLLPVIPEVMAHVDVAEGKMIVRDIEPYAVTNED